MWTYGKEQARILLTYKFKGESGFWTHSQKTCNKHHLTTPVIELLRTKNNVAQEQLQKRCYVSSHLSTGDHGGSLSLYKISW